MSQLRNGSFHQSITVTVLFPVIPCLVSQLLGVIGMTIGERQNAAAYRFSIHILTQEKKAILEKLIEVILRNLTLLHQISKMIESGFLFFEDFLHHRFLAT